MKKHLSANIITITALCLMTSWAYAVKPVNVKVPVDKRGMTAEQKNVADRVIIDNKVGSIKHLYVISAMSGDVIIYSTVKGKVTSSGKRLQPKSVLSANGNSGASIRGAVLKNNGIKYRTSELMQDDGTYGNSIHYLYWWDSAGIYHQHYVSGGQIIHISDQPLVVKSIIINMSK